MNRGTDQHQGGWFHCAVNVLGTKRKHEQRKSKQKKQQEENYEDVSNKYVVRIDPAECTIVANRLDIIKVRATDHFIHAPIPLVVWIHMQLRQRVLSAYVTIKHKKVLGRNFISAIDAPKAVVSQAYTHRIIHTGAYSAYCVFLHELEFI